MKFLISNPRIESVRTGNACTARQWASILESLGHSLVYSDQAEVDVLVALHATKSRDVIERFRSRHPNGAVVLALTGTDIYPEPDASARRSMELAEALVVLQKRALERIPRDQQYKARVIVQSVQRNATAPEEKSSDPFVVCVVGHLRDVKDPMRAAQAARCLPPNSKIRIAQAGAVIDAKYEALVEREQKENPRYEYLGELPPERVHRLMCRSQATILSSFSEGGARVIGESIVEGTPVLATRIDGVTGLVGEDYPGLFSAGNTAELAALLEKLETDATFRDTLNQETQHLAPIFDPDLERKAWQVLIDSLSNHTVAE